MTSKRTAAVALAKLGRRVFPLAINGKTPAHARVDWTKTATSDPARVYEMWTDPVFGTEIDYNIGRALDRDTLIVDTDVRDGKQGAQSLALLEAIYDELPPTCTVITPSGGDHREFTTEDSAKFAAVLGTDIDLKGFGGYVVAPGSTIDGKAYRLKDDTAPAPLPPWVASHAPAKRHRERVTSDGNAIAELDTADAVKRAAEYLSSRAPDHGTFKVACRIKDYGVSREQCLDLMMDHWPPAEAKGTDHVEFRVNNAYSFGQNAVGIASPEAEFDAVEIDIDIGKPTSKRRGLYFIPWAAAKPDLAQPYLIDDVMDLGAMVVTYGDSNAGKTYVKLDQCFCIAAGRDWNGHKVKQGLVVYIAAEGGKGFQKRIEAFKRHYGVDDLPFALIPCPIDLQSERADTKKLIKVIREAEAHFGMPCVMAIVDTLARAMSGGDENLASDMGKFVDNVDEVRAAIGCTVDIIHHTGKDKAKGARGSSALRAATDTEIEIEPGVFAVQKQRDLEKIDKSEFRLVSVDVGHRPDGKAVTACVVEWVVTNEFDAQVSPLAQQMLDCLEQILEAKRDEIDEDETLSDEQKAAARRVVKSPWLEWQLSALSCLKGPRGKSLSRTNLFPLRLELSNSGLVAKDHSKQWFIK